MGKQSGETLDRDIIGHEVLGSGPCKVMILHGWFGDHRIWEPTYRFLNTTQFTFAFLDYRGYGASRGMTGQHSMAQISADTMALANHLGWQDFAVVGHSMGGQAAQRVALDAGGRVRAMVGIAPVGAMGAKMPPEAKAFFDRVADDDAVGHQVIDGSVGNRLKPAIAQYVMRFTRETTETEAFRDYGQAFMTTDFAEAAKAIAVPILILVGEHDGGVTEQSVRSTFPSLYPQAEIEILPNSGHYPMIETPAWLMTRIEQFLTESLTDKGSSDLSGA